MAELLKWQEEYVERVTKMDNDALFTEFEEVSIPDDYDGCFTTRGAWEKNMCRNLLIDRLKDSGFLPYDYD